MGRAPQAPARSLKARAIQWLAQREHSRVELRRKLLAHALAEDAQVRGAHSDADAGSTTDAAATDVLARLDALLDWLEAHQYLSEQRFAESRVHARAPRFGNLRIRQELAQHQVGLSAAAESALKETELARARAVWQRKFLGSPAGVAERVKQARFLAGRGFSSEVIHKLLRDAYRPDLSDASTEPDAD